MSQFRSKILDLGCFVNVRNIRDHTKRKVFEQNEVERYDFTILLDPALAFDNSPDPSSLVTQL